MKLMEAGDKLVWMVRREEDEKYLRSTSYSENRVVSMRQAHVWKQKASAVAIAERWTDSAKGAYTYHAVPFALVEVDPDSIVKLPRSIANSPELEKMLESKI